MTKRGAKEEKFEVTILPWLKVLFPGITRTGQGEFNAGDYEGTGDFTIEAKARKEMRLGEWMKSTQATMRRVGGCWPVIIHKRRQYGPSEAYVTMPLEAWVDMLATLRGIEVPEGLEPVSEDETPEDFR